MKRAEELRQEERAAQTAAPAPPRGRLALNIGSSKDIYDGAMSSYFQTSLTHIFGGLPWGPSCDSLVLGIVVLSLKPTHSMPARLLVVAQQISRHRTKVVGFLESRHI